MQQQYVWTAMTLLFCLPIFGQQTSFETSEGYPTNSQIHGINGWHETTGNSRYFVISDEKSSGGNQALKLKHDPEWPQLTADWNFDTALTPEDNLEISANIYAPGNGTLYWKIMAGENYAGYIIIQDENVFPAEVTVVNPVPIAMAPINVEAFNEIKLIYNYTESSITYFVNGSEIHQDSLWGSTAPIDAYSFEGFLFSDIFIDDFGTNSVLKINTPNAAPFVHYIHEQSLFIEAMQPVDRFELYDILGKKLSAKNVHTTKAEVSLSDINSGVYIARIIIDGRPHSFKIVKP